MARIKTFHTLEDFAGIDDPQTTQAAAELFGYLFPSQASPAIDDAHLGLAIAAHNPKLAQQLAQTSRLIALDLPWCQRTDLRELAIQTVNAHFQCTYAFNTRAAIAASAGISREMQDALPSWQSSNLFDDEQRLVIAYSQAVPRGPVPAELFGAVVEKYGEKGAVEFTALVGFWSFWAMLLNATAGDSANSEDNRS